MYGEASGWHIVASGDYNGDGFADVINRNDSTGAMIEWLGGSKGYFPNDVAVNNITADASWQLVGSGDFNGDGISDLLWRNSGGYLTEWLGSSSGVFSSNQANAGTGLADNSWHVVGIGDFNGDGTSDILWRNTDGYLTEWLGTSNGSFVSNQANAGTGIADNSWQVVGIGDFNGDGTSDILWRNTGGYVTEWLGTSNGSFVSNQANAGNGSADNSWTVAEIGDFNGDEHSDILWRNTSGYITEWTATTNGGFVSNQANAGTGIADNSWHVLNFLG